jgi:hypothetical protein
MQMVDFNSRFVEVQRLVCVVVVMDILAVHHQVLKLKCRLCQRHRSECRHGLPQEDGEQNKGAQVTGHFGI